MKMVDTLSYVTKMEPRVAFEGTGYARDVGDKVVTIASFRGAVKVLEMTVTLFEGDVRHMMVGQRVTVTLEAE